MKHHFEFIAILNDGGHVKMNYKGKSSRHTKVQKCILQDLERTYNIKPTEVKEFYLKDLKQR